MTDLADRDGDVPPTMPIGPPPVGLVISSLLDWPTFSRTYPGMERYWQPADGRELPADSVLAQVLSRHGKPTRFLPDLRGAVLRGTPADAASGAAPARLASVPDAGPGIRTQPIYFYVRCN